MYRSVGKPFLDKLLAALLLIVLSPLFIVVMLLVRFKLGSPIFFRQPRPGLHGRAFTLYKLRTMTNAKDAKGNLLPDAKRLTPFGQFLRSTSLDELPELWNVFKGEMSLIGPRPLMMQYLDRYTLEQMRRHAVKPGITGWAQINGRNAISWEDRLTLDVWYVDHQSFWIDLQIALRTLWTVVKREGISSEGHVTMPEFRGINK